MERKTREILKYFAMDFPAVKTTELTGLSPKTMDDWRLYARETIAAHQEDEKQEVYSGEVEMDESYF